MLVYDGFASARRFHVIGGIGTSMARFDPQGTPTELIGDLFVSIFAAISPCGNSSRGTRRASDRPASSPATRPFSTFRLMRRARRPRRCGLRLSIAARPARAARAPIDGPEHPCRAQLPVRPDAAIAEH
jgi:hypothetical protein